MWIYQEQIMPKKKITLILQQVSASVDREEGNR